MSVISIKAFEGLRPVRDPLLLRESEATVSLNTQLSTGALTALKSATTLKALTKAAPLTLFRYGTSGVETDYWLEFLADTDVMRSPVVDDAYARLYWTDGGTPQYAPNNLILSGASYPGASYNLGIPKPAAAPVVSTFTAATTTSTDTRAYVYTYVSAYGEEGPPSAASSIVTLDPSLPVGLTGMSVAPSGPYNITLKRLYRTSYSGTTSEFQFVAEFPVANTTYADTIIQAALGEVLPSEDWVAPPTGLKGLKMLANGAAIGFVGNVAHLSEPNLPHAWPHKYPIDEQIVGIGVFRQSAVLLTNSFPYLISGADPRAMSIEKMELPQACVSKRSIVDTGDGVLYASPDGLVSISSSGVALVTKDLLTREQWQAYNPSSIFAYSHDNRYHMFYTTSGGVRGMVIFDFSNQGAAMQQSDINTSTAVTAGYHDARTDTLYLAQGTNIVRFNAGTALSYTWRSKVFRTPAPLNFGTAQVRAAAYPVTFKLYADAALKHTQTVSSASPFRLPSGYVSADWEVELTGTATVTQVSFATSVAELSSV